MEEGTSGFFFPVCAGSLVPILMGRQEGGLPTVWAVAHGSSPQVEARLVQEEVDWLMQSLWYLNSRYFYC